MVPTCSVWIPRVPTYSGFRLFLSVFNYGAFTLSRSAFHLSSSNLFLLMTYPLPLSYFYVRFGLLRFRSPLLSESLLFSSPPGTEMFQFPGFSSLKLCIGLRMITHFLVIGFPHSDTPGSLNVYFSPRRFAVFCVLLLLYMPRHPPYALLHLITLLENF